MSDDCESELVAAWREKLNTVDDMKFRQAMQSRLDKLVKRRGNGDPVDRLWLRIEQDYDNFLKQRGGRLAEYAALLKREYPAHLPLVGELENIKNTIKAHQVVIVCGSTGSGKSTQLPKILLDCGYGCRGRIGCTQPRRIAAVAMARRVAHECGGEANNLVSSQVRFDDRSSESTVIKFMTDGILLAETRNDPDLRQYDALIIDEAHERSLNIDFILGYLRLLLERRKDLKVIISSATLDAENFAAFFPDSGIITVEGRSFEVEDYFMPPLDDEDLSGNVGRAVDFIRDFDNSGDILVFLPGEREIRDAADLLTGRRLERCEILPLYGRLSMGEQQRVFANSSGGNRRIVLATNVAETSLTIPNITYVIDSGLARISRYNPRTQVQELQIEQISQASAKQRRGRCGRIREGICIHLYSEDDLSRSRDYTEPEIRRTSLAGVILQMAILRLPEIQHFPFIDPPQSMLIREGIRTLTEIGALNGKGQVTAAGRKIAALPLDPHLGKMICESERLKVLPEVMVLTSYLSIQDPRERPSDAQQAADQAHKRFYDEKSDFMGIINLWNFIQQERANGLSNNGIRKLCIKNFLNYKRISEWRNFVCDLAEYAGEYNWDLPPEIGVLSDTPYDQLHKAILSGVPRNFAMYDKENQIYIGGGNRKFNIFYNSSLYKTKSKPEWIMFFALIETSKVFSRLNAVIKVDFVSEVAPHLCKSVYDNVAWDESSGFVYARERKTCCGLLVCSGRRVHYGEIDPAAAKLIFIEEALLSGAFRSKNPAWKRCSKVIEELRRLEIKTRRPETILDLDALRERFNEILPPEVCSSRALEKFLQKNGDKLQFNPEDIMQAQYHKLRPEDYPDKVEFGGHWFEIRYYFDPGEELDGACIVAAQDEIALLPAWALEYPPLGLLAEKVELLLKSLPKSERIKCNPITPSAEEFVEAIREKLIFSGQSLLDALIEYLQEFKSVDIHYRDFDVERLPGYLKGKLLEVDDAGNLVKVHHSIPSDIVGGSRVSAYAGGKNNNLKCSGSLIWPENKVLPEFVELPGESGRNAFVALCDEIESVGVEFFLKDGEAREQHRRGVSRLFILQQGELQRYLKRESKFDRQLVLSWFLEDHSKRYLDDCVLHAVSAALGDCWQIRSGFDFNLAIERGRNHAAEELYKLKTQLESFYESYEKIRILLNKVKERSSGSAESIRAQLKFLFRVGFISIPDLLERYPRYLKGLLLRAERAACNPAKDLEKYESISEYVEKFYLAAGSVADLGLSRELVEFYKLLAEVQLNTFSPEIRTLEKCSAAKLAAAWDDLRF